MSFKNNSILIVDDEPTIRLTLSAILRLEGYIVDEVENGMAALSRLGQKNYSLMIIDLNMPEMSGMDVLKLTSESYPMMKVIILTAYGSMTTAIEALQRRVHDYLLKPISPQQVVESVSLAFAEPTDSSKISDQLSGYQPRPAQIPDQKGIKGRVAYLPGGVTVDCKKQIVSWDDQALTLTPTESRLLNVLFEQFDTVVAYADIVYLIHGYSVEPEEAATILRPLLSRLRRKLQDAPNGDTWIKTVRGTGYLVDQAKVL